MRWRIRSQLLVPLLLLLLGVIGSSVWIGLASVERVRRQIETRLRAVAFNLIKKHGPQETTLEEAPTVLPPASTVHDDWKTLDLGPSVVVAGKPYLCGAL